MIDIPLVGHRLERGVERVLFLIGLMTAIGDHVQVAASLLAGAPRLDGLGGMLVARAVELHVVIVWSQLVQPTSPRVCFRAAQQLSCAGG